MPTPKSTPDWTEDNAGLSYADPARGIRARIWPMFHGGYSWYVMQNRVTVARGGTPKGTAEARQAAEHALGLVENSPGVSVPGTVGGV